MIIVQLTPEEAAGHEAAGDIQDKEIKNTLFLRFHIAQGMARDEADALAGQLAEAAIRARKKIEEARRYQIQIVDGE